MNKWMFFKTALITFSLSGCSLASATNPGINVLAEKTLSRALQETSGLTCDATGNRFTINDSGNNPLLFRVDDGGKIASTYKLPFKNQDWEAVAADHDSVFIADVGNNNGKRARVFVYKLAKSALDSGEFKKIELSYKNNNRHENVSFSHDYDAEALVATDDNLLLFSKSWKSRDLHIYSVDKTDADQSLTPIKTIKGLNLLVTGADYDKLNQRYVLVGYNVGGFGAFDPYLIFLSKDMGLLDKVSLRGFGQVEAVCVESNGDIWFTQEGSAFSTAKLVKIRLTRQTSEQLSKSD